MPAGTPNPTPTGSVQNAQPAAQLVCRQARQGAERHLHVQWRLPIQEAGAAAGFARRCVQLAQMLPDGGGALDGHCGVWVCVGEAGRRAGGRRCRVLQGDNAARLRHIVGGQQLLR